MATHKRSNRTIRHYSVRHKLSRWIGGIAAVATILASVGTSHAASLSSASVALSDPRPTQAAVTYAFTGSSVSVTPIKCIKTMFADTSTGNNVPLNMVTTGASYDTTNSNYTPTPGAWTFNKTTNGTFTLIDAAGETPSAANRKLIFTGITNGSTPDTKYFMRVTTFNNTDCASSPVDNVTIDYIFTNGSTLTLTVDPTLTFSVNAVAAGQNCNGATSTQPSFATSIPFGYVTAAANQVVCQDLTASTNATNGYTITTRYTNKPINSISQTIADAPGSNTTPSAFPAPGTEAYGYTTSDSTLNPANGATNRFNSNLWAAMSTTPAEVAFESAGDLSTTYRVGHQVGVSLTTKPGTYTTTIIYTCTPIY